MKRKQTRWKSEEGFRRFKQRVEGELGHRLVDSIESWREAKYRSTSKPPVYCTRCDTKCVTSPINALFNNQVDIMCIVCKRTPKCKILISENDSLRLFVHRDFNGSLDEDVTRGRQVFRCGFHIPYEARTGNLRVLANGSLRRFDGIRWQTTKAHPIHDRVVRIDTESVELDGVIFRVVDPRDCPFNYVSPGLDFITNGTGVWQRQNLLFGKTNSQAGRIYVGLRHVDGRRRGHLRWQALRAACWAWRNHVDGIVDPRAKNIIDGITDVSQLGELIHCHHRDGDKTNNILSNGVLMRKEDHYVEPYSDERNRNVAISRANTYRVCSVDNGEVVFEGIGSEAVALTLGVNGSTITRFARNGKAFKAKATKYAGQKVVVQNLSNLVKDRTGEKWVDFPYKVLGIPLPKQGQNAKISNYARVRNIYGVTKDYNNQRLPAVGIGGKPWSVAKLVAFCFHRDEAITCLREAHPTLSIAEAFRQRNIHPCHQQGYNECDNTAAAVRLGTHTQNTKDQRRTFWLWPEGNQEECKEYVGVEATAQAKGWHSGTLSGLLRGKRKSAFHGMRGSYAKPTCV